MSGCHKTDAEHRAMKEPGVWETLRFSYYHPGGGEDGGDIEGRNAPCCGTTLTRPCVLTAEQAARARIANQRKADHMARVVEAIRAHLPLPDATWDDEPTRVDLMAAQ